MRIYTEKEWLANNMAIEEAETAASRLKSLLTYRKTYLQPTVQNGQKIEVECVKNEPKTYLEGELEEIRYLCSQILSHLDDYRR